MEYKPVIGINEYRRGQVAGRKEILFNLITGPRYIDKAHRHDFFMVILYERGAGIHNIDSIDHVISDREVHVLFPGQLHKWDLKPETVAYQLMIERRFFEGFSPYFRFSFTNYQNHPVIQLKEEDYLVFLHEFTAIKNELQAPDSLVDLIRAHAAVIAAIISKQASEHFEEFRAYQSNPRLAKFNLLIDRYYKQERTVSFYAEQLGLTANYLNVLCKRALKVTANYLIQQRLLTESKRMLQNSSINIKEIAYELGFTDQAHFSRFFKSHSGFRPGELREKR